MTMMNHRNGRRRSSTTSSSILFLLMAMAPYDLLCHQQFRECHECHPVPATFHSHVMSYFRVIAIAVSATSTASATGHRHGHPRHRRRIRKNIRPPLFRELSRRILSASPPTVLNYGPRGHPWERRNDATFKINTNENGKRTLQVIPQNEHIAYQQKEHRYPISPSDYQPIRLAFHTGPLDDYDGENDNVTVQNTTSTAATATATTFERNLRIATLKERVLPSLAANFSELLRVVPVEGGIPLRRTVVASEEEDRIVQSGSCFGIYDDYLTSGDVDPGIPNADLVVFVSALEVVAGVDVCSAVSYENGNENEKVGTAEAVATLAAAAGCELDQYDRPVVGLVNFCLDFMDVTLQNDDDDDHGDAIPVVAQDMVDLFVRVAMHEFTHVLGINSDMMKYYRDANTGEPLTPRPFTFLDADSPSSEPLLDSVSCAPDGATPDPQRPIVLPSCNTLRSTVDSRGWHSWRIVLPTVVQVARNQFGCQTLEGVALENQPTNPLDCFGSHWDERDYYSETMSAYFAQEADFFSPLSLALLQDTGWYWPNYRAAKVSPFGHGAGCGFVQGDCIVDGGEVPEYGKGFFCNEGYDGNSTPRFLCDPSATHKAVCDLLENGNPPSSHQYFANPSVGPLFDRADWCPIAREGTINCADGNSVLVFDEGFLAPMTLPEETYSPESKCFERVDGDALCLAAFCSREPRVLTVRAGSEIFTCSSDFQVVSFTSEIGTPVQFLCPRLAAACPELFCPANCSGKGICNFDSATPYCECFDPNDSSDGCYDSLPKSPEKCEKDFPLASSDAQYLTPVLSFGIWGKIIGIVAVISTIM